MLAAFALLAVVARGGERELAVAREALRDGLWEIARNHVSNDVSAVARLITLEAFAGEGKWQEIAAALERWKDAVGDGFDYYRAIVKGDHETAMKVLRRGGTREGCREADLYEAGELAKSGRSEDAARIWRTLAADTNASARVFALAAMNLGDVALLRRAYAREESVDRRRQVGFRLGTLLLDAAATAEEGEKLVRALVKESPDAVGAKAAFLALAESLLVRGQWQPALDTYREAVEIWPELARVAEVQEGSGRALHKLGRTEEAIASFKRAGELAQEDEARARALVQQGDVLQELGKDEESMAHYREALDRYPSTTVAVRLKKVVEVRELEQKGREFYKSFKFPEAAQAFADVAKADPSRQSMMDFFAVLCLYGQGRDDEAMAGARRLVTGCPDAAVRAEATLWLAKFLYNRREWNECVKLFEASAAGKAGEETAAEALLWAARAAFNEEDYARAIQLVSELAEKHPKSPRKPEALMVQGEALVEESRYDEAVLVLDRLLTAEGVEAAVKVRAQLLKADALFALGADNLARYSAALEIYRSVGFGGRLSGAEQIAVSFKIARSLEKLKRLDEAMDVYYTQVVLAYRERRQAGERMDDEARAAFSRAAFRLADEFEHRGEDRQARQVLRLVEKSDVPAAEEAARRRERISNKGRIL